MDICSSEGHIARFEKIGMAAALFLMVAFMIWNPTGKTFTYDELDWTVRFVDSGSYLEMLKGLLTYGYNLPLYYTIVYVVFQFLPHTEIWLLLPSILFVIAGILAMYQTAKENYNILYARFVFWLGITSGILVSQGGWKLRPYAMTFCFSAFTLLYFLRRQREDTGKNRLMYGVFMTLLIYSHWFGALLCAFYGLCDLVLFFRKKVKFSCIISYVGVGVCFIPWFILMMVMHTNNFADYWGPIPDIHSPVSTISYLFNRNRLLVIIFALTVLIQLFIIWKNRKQKQTKDTLLFLFMLSAIAFVMITVFIYSRYINPDGSLYVNRYFFVVIPHLLMITAAAFSWCYQCIPWKKVICILLVLFFAGTGVLSYQKAMEDTIEAENPYKAAAIYLSENQETLSDSSLIVTAIGKEWVSFYLSPRMEQMPLNFAFGTQEFYYYEKDGIYVDKVLMQDEDVLQYDTIYMFELHSHFSDKVNQFIEEHYKLQTTDEESNLRVFVRK